MRHGFHKGVLKTADCEMINNTGATSVRILCVNNKEACNVARDALVAQQTASLEGVHSTGANLEVLFVGAFIPLRPCCPGFCISGIRDVIDEGHGMHLLYVWSFLEEVCSPRLTRLCSFVFGFPVTSPPSRARAGRSYRS